MIKDLINKARWLSRFKNNWVVEWILRKAVDQYIINWQRKTGINIKMRHMLFEVSFLSPSNKFTFI